ncbi:MAG: type III toxin-antitoxin system ToxN/AbiQ family toxin [Lachnospiraceae bacterium]|nr:type III toxin-antitoxin system ToxN/AbiQ family toxin [Lachnospiraceae bacterium]
MKQRRLNLYLIDMKYIRNLSKVDDNVMSVSPQIEKEKRPFVGIIIVCDMQEYCVPLSSPKHKHESMKNDVDFTKIIVEDKLLGVLNFNNMIPVDESCISPVDLKVTGKDSPQSRRYKKMAAKQLSWCQGHQDEITKKANKLYKMIESGKASGLLKRRCCDFAKLETVLQKWENSQ